MKHFSATELNLFLRCPFAWNMNYVIGIKPPKTDALWFGISIHAAIESFYSKLDPVVTVEALLDKEGIPESFDREKNKNEYLQMLELYKKEGPHIDEVISLEQRNTILLSHPVTKEKLTVPFTFKMDMIAKIQDEIYVIDYKSMKSSSSKQDISNKIQAILYTMCYRELYGTSCDGFFQIGLVRLKKPKILPVSFKYTLEEEIWVWELAKKFIDITNNEKQLETQPIIQSFYPCPAKIWGCPHHSDNQKNEF